MQMWADRGRIRFQYFCRFLVNCFCFQGVTKFLKEMSKLYEVVIFTASVSGVRVWHLCANARALHRGYPT